ncbi:hypothetical protein NST83_21715 [Paenibacillus sp. FSL R10-2782]|uniref:hypothetical protein n=1 Tax=Paenibacillus sp. FSL R10-2782 TaxID=2954661 RepID=UPI003158F58D
MGLSEHYGAFWDSRPRASKEMDEEIPRLGEFGLLDQREHRKEYTDQDRNIQKLKRENEMLKKCLEIWMQEVKRLNIESLRAPQKITPLATSANSLLSPKVDITLS